MNLALQLKKTGHDIIVVSCIGDGVFGEDLLEAGVRLERLRRASYLEIPSSFMRFLAIWRSEKPDVIQGFMPLANIMIGLGALFAGRKGCAWGVRASNMKFSDYSFLSRVSNSIEVWLSRIPPLIVSNSEAGKKYAIELGMPEDKISVVPNGLDTSRFRFDRQQREALREEWGIEKRQILVSQISRIDPMKGVETFLNVAQMVLEKEGNVSFAWVGEGGAAFEASARKRAEDLGVGDRINWIGMRRDMPGVYSAVDIVLLCSDYGEGFPNVLGEAMLCGRICVATDVGDSRLVVGDDRNIFEAGDFVGISDRIIEIIKAGEYIGDLACKGRRESVATRFSVRDLLERSVACWRKNL